MREVLDLGTYLRTQKRWQNIDTHTEPRHEANPAEWLGSLTCKPNTATNEAQSSVIRKSIIQTQAQRSGLMISFYGSLTLYLTGAHTIIKYKKKSLNYRHGDEA